MTAEPVPGRFALLGAALKNRLVGRVLTAYLAFNVAEWAGWIAFLTWGFTEWGITGASGVALTQLIPSAMVAAPLAVWLGRRSRAAMLAWGYLGQAVAYGVPGAMILADLPAVAVVCVAAPASLTVALTRPAHHAILPDISRTTADLTAANALSGFAEAAATFLGPALVAVTLTFGGPGPALVGCAVRMLGATVATAGAGRHAARSDHELGIGAAGGQLRSVLAHPDARILSLLVLAEYALLGMSDILLVVLALDVLNLSEGGPGTLNAALGVGGLIGSALTVFLVGRSRLAGPLTVGAVGTGSAFAATGAATTLVPALIPIAAAGAFRLQYQVASRTLIQRLLPDRLLAAMFGLQESVMLTGLALGTLGAPLLVGLVGPRWAFVAAGALLPAVALLGIRRLRRLDSSVEVPHAVSGLLRSVPSLTLLPPRQLDRMAIDAVRVPVAAAGQVVAEGDPGEGLYVIESGTVKVSVRGETIRTLGPGQWFGELALLRDIPRTATVTAREPCVLWCVDRETFRGSVLRSDPSVESIDRHAEDTYHY